jgi:hypothetical protein
MDERRHVHQLDGDPGHVRRRAIVRCGEEDEQRPQPLAAGGERLGADRRGQPGMTTDRADQALLDLLEVFVEPLRLVDRRQRVQAATPVCSATMPPA